MSTILPDVPDNLTAKAISEKFSKTTKIENLYNECLRKIAFGGFPCQVKIVHYEPIPSWGWRPSKSDYHPIIDKLRAAGYEAKIISKNCGVDNFRDRHIWIPSKIVIDNPLINN